MNKQNRPVKLKGLELCVVCKYIKEKYRINVSPARIRRWIRSGLVSCTNHRVFLQAEKHACWLTTRRWVNAFISKLQEFEEKQSINEVKIEDTDRLFNLKKAQRYIRKEYNLIVTLPTLRNWIRKGRMSLSNRRFILQARKRAGASRGWHTCKKWIDAYIAELDQ